MSRASVHNISIMEELELGVGDEIEVYKANMIIPQIAQNLTRSGVKDIPKVCPVCGARQRSAGSAMQKHCIVPIRNVRQSMSKHLHSLRAVML